MEPARSIDRLLEIMAALRDPQTGCPWDVEQTFSTIQPYTIEEAYEVADAIERNDMADLTDELGDLLLQVVFHAQMAKELGVFEFGDVVEAITRKMIRRHPHVFGAETVRGKKLAKGTWEKIKAQEKAEKAARTRHNGETTSLLDDVPRALPALMRAVKLQKKAATVGFDWDTAPPIVEKIKEEIGEMEEAMRDGNQAHVREEYGDLLFALANLGRHLDIEPEDALSAANAKFTARFNYIENSLKADKKPIAEAGLAAMEVLWNEAKSKLKPAVETD